MKNANIRLISIIEYYEGEFNSLMQLLYIKETEEEIKLPVVLIQESVNGLQTFGLS